MCGPEQPDGLRGNLGFRSFGILAISWGLAGFHERIGINGIVQLICAVREKGIPRNALGLFGLGGSRSLQVVEKAGVTRVFVLKTALTLATRVKVVHKLGVIEVLDRLFLNDALLEPDLQFGEAFLYRGFLFIVVGLEFLQFVDFLLKLGDLLPKLDLMSPAILEKCRLA